MSRPRLTASVPTLPSLSFDETVAFYEKLGFAEEFRDIGLLGLSRDGVRVHFWLTGNRRLPASSSCWFDVEGVEELYAAWLPLGIIPRRGHLDEKPWGYKEFSAIDCHGNLLRFCEPMPQAQEEMLPGSTLAHDA